MFGYVLPQKPEMRVRDFEAYRAVYCGLCKQLGNSYGVFSRFLLNYDLVLVAVVADALSGESGEVRCEGCFANPLATRPTLYTTAGLQLAGDGLLLLSWHKMQDNLQDEKGIKRLFYRFSALAFRRAAKKATQRQPQLAQALALQMERQHQLEQNGCAAIDEAADPTAQMCAAIFAAAAQTDAQRAILYRMGLFCGQIVYLLDAAEDYPEDEKNGGYNVFLRMDLTHQQAVFAAQQRCRMAAGEIALCYNLLGFKQYKEILDNIFFLGLPQSIRLAGQKRNRKGSEHGQIAGV